MRSTFSLLLLASVAAAVPAQAKDDPRRGVEAVNEPIVTRSDYVFDAAAPDGRLSSVEQARLDAWLAGLGLDFGDRVYISGDASGSARYDVAQVIARYGMLVSNGAPVAGGVINPGSVRVIVSRTRATMAGCPNWSGMSQPNFGNRTMPNYGCAVNGNLAAMVADPQDLVSGRGELPGSDGFAGAKAIKMYRDWPLTGVTDGQAKRPLKKPDTRSGGGGE
ncbi:CpaD family pilus assembly lipoprotein [Sphingomonas mesophila]|uniref:CpaD family pilus assembly lipoprotein n=1 Tax=Sphingomonas mesophila TaxID=2303576 RepID=UPI000E571DDD|nr:CpaD family pilus assembly lipoprotein [Sphingomonas mesophila]